MPLPSSRPLVLRTLLALACLGGASALQAAPLAAVHDAAKAQQQPMLDTMRDLVGIESGSKDVEGVERIAALIGERFKALGGKVEIIQPADIFRLDDTPERVGPMVHAEFKGSGQKKIMLIAHMDTVYRNGMLKDQPFRIDGDRAYGLGIADDKHGVATILHTLALLQKLGFKDYGTLTVLINGDEEISSPGARALKVADFDALERTLQERIQKKLLPDAKVSLKFEVRRPPLEATPASRALANHGVAIYQELGLPMKVIDRASGGGTDAAFAALKARGPVIEGMGLSGFGAHSNDAEYIQIPSIVPRLYLAARMIMDVSQDKAPMK